MGKGSFSNDPLIGQIVGGRYEVIRMIGKGGMGAIYEIRNTRLGRAFAMKTLIGEAADDAEVLARFRREADVISRIKHPHIVEVIDWESLEDGSPCMILEYLQGEDLARRVRDAAPMPWLFIAKVGDQILSALSVAHAAGVIHRDLKPQNIFLALDDSGEERAKLLDFGVSKIRDSRSLMTTDARLLGTPAYMSPEQAEGRHDDVGTATDLWAMGAILHEMATGELVFSGASMPAVLYRICSRDADDVSLARTDAPPAFTQLVREALARDLDQRIGDADVFRVRLREALADVAPQARYSDRQLVSRPMPTPLPMRTPTGPTSPTPNRRKRHTGATDRTVSSGTDIGAAQTVQSGSFPLANATPSGAGQISASTLPPRRRRSTPLLVAFAGAATAMIVVAIIVASTREPGTSTARTTTEPVPKRVEPVVVVDAGMAIVELDAAVIAPPVEVKPVVNVARPGTVKRDRVRVDPRNDPPKVVPPKPDPPKPDPPKPKCDKKDPNYMLCINGEDR